MIDLGDLANPTSYCDAIDLGNAPTGGLLDDLHRMIRIRAVEMAIAELVRSGEARCPCHLAVGQEAVSVGISRALRATDRGYGNHRSHGHYLAAGGSMEGLLAEVLGRETGCSKGMGGSMHLYAADVGFHGSVPIVAGTVPLAAGAALAAKFDKKGDVAIAYFGDGACEEGVVHETLNMAAVMKLPMLFVVENNLFSSHLDIHLRQPANSTSRFADANCVRARVVDGNDVVAVARAAHELVDAARRGEGPGFLEAVTYRWLGHVGANEDIDVGVKRSEADVVAWKKRDPVGRLERALLDVRGVDPATIASVRADVGREVDDALTAARAGGYPPPSSLLDAVYAAPARAAEPAL